MQRHLSRRVAVPLLVGAALALGSAGGAVASPTFRLAIMHVVQDCHVWKSGHVLGSSAKIEVRGGTKLVIRPMCPMDFDFFQVSGPKLRLGDPRTVRGSTRTIVFRKPGVYRIRAKNVQSPAEVGLQILGSPNTLRLTVVVR